MEKRTMLALLLIILVFWAFNKFIWKSQSQPVQQEKNVQPAVTIQDSIPTQTILPDETKIEFEETISDTEIRNDLILENDLMKIVFSNKGGIIKSVQLKDYFLNDKITPVDLIPNGLEMLNIELADRKGNISNLATKGFQYFLDGNRLRFTFQTENRKIEKTFILGKGYELEFNLNIDGTEEISDYFVSMESGIAETEDSKGAKKSKPMDFKILAQIDNVVTKKGKYALRKLKEQVILPGKVDWAAVRSKYFVLGISPDDLVFSDKLTASRNNYLENGENKITPAMKIRTRINRAEFTNSYRLYLGPIIGQNLKAFSPGFEKIQESPFLFGETLRPLSNLFNLVFRTLHKGIPNYGIIILIFALLLKIVLYPLTHKSFESSTKMQKVQPLMKEIQTKYKKDPKQMQLELKKLYKEHGVSPLGGCLPMLLQMPIFFAIYPLIRYSIDLRQTSFLWLYDLSEPDPYYILPILMAVFMFVQQKLMTPSRQSLENMDEKQKAQMQSQKMMMYLMPVMMLFIFSGLSSGLVLYWTVFSILSSVQQMIIKKKFKQEKNENY